MLTKAFLYASLSVDTILVEENTEWRHVKRQLGPLLRDKYCWLIEGMRIADLIVNIGVGWRDLSDDKPGLRDLLGNVRHDKTGPVGLIRPYGRDLKLLTDWPDYFFIELIVGLCELHDHERGRPLSFYLETRDFDIARILAPKTNLVVWYYKREVRDEHLNAIDRECEPGACHSDGDVVVPAGFQASSVATGRMIRPATGERAHDEHRIIADSSGDEGGGCGLVGHDELAGRVLADLAKTNGATERAAGESLVRDGIADRRGGLIHDLRGVTPERNAVVLELELAQERMPSVHVSHTSR